MSVFIGLDFRRKNCCVLHCDFDFEFIQKHLDKFSATDFKHNCTNWGGCDEVERTLRESELKLTGREILLPRSMEFAGTDFDMGGKEEWVFSVSSLLEAEHDFSSAHFCQCDNCKKWIYNEDWFYTVPYNGNYLNFCEDCCRVVRAMPYLKALRTVNNDFKTTGKSKTDD